MPTAVNPQTGEMLELKGGQWQPVPVAVNPQTGARVRLIDGQWQPDAPPAGSAQELSRDVGQFQAERTAKHTSALTPQRVEETRERLRPIGEGLREHAPEIAATLATLPIGGQGGAAALAARGAGPGLAKTLPGALGDIGRRFVFNPAQLAARAGAAGGGAAVLAEDGVNIDTFIDNAFEQGAADPLSRLTVGFGKFLLRPAGKALSDQTQRMIEFMRKERLQFDPGAVTEKLIPQVITNFAKNFIGSRIASRRQLRAIGDHISSDPAAVDSFFKKIVGDVMPEQLENLNVGVTKAVQRIARAPGRLRRSGSRAAKPSIIETAAKAPSGSTAAQVLFSDPKALSHFKSKASPKEWAGMLQAHTKNMIDRAARTTESGNRIIDGALLKEELDRNASSLAKYYPKAVIERLENFAAYAKAHSGVVAELADAPIVTPKSIALTAVAAGGAAALDPLGIGGGTILLSTALATQIFHPRAAMSRWLTTGLVPRSLGLRLAGDVAANVPTRDVLSEAAGVGRQEFERLSAP